MSDLPIQNQPANLTGTNMKSLRDMRERNRHTRAAFQFLTDMKNAGQIDLDEFDEQKLISFLIPNSTNSGSIEIKFYRNSKPASVNLFAKMGRNTNGEQNYRIEYKSWDATTNPLNEPPDGWKFTGLKPEPKAEVAAPINPRRERSRREEPVISSMESFNPKWLLAMKELLYGK